MPHRDQDTLLAATCRDPPGLGSKIRVLRVGGHLGNFDEDLP
jgi:hypothetical protein